MTDLIKSDNTAVCKNLEKAVRAKYPGIRRLFIKYTSGEGFGIHYEDKRFAFSDVYRTIRDALRDES